MIINVLEPDELRDAAEEWDVLAAEASKQGKYKLARTCRDHARLYEQMAAGLERLHKSRELMKRPHPHLRAVGSDEGEE